MGGGGKGLRGAGELRRIGWFGGAASKEMWRWEYVTFVIYHQYGRISVFLRITIQSFNE